MRIKVVSKIETNTLLIIISGLISFACSRGRDGQPFLGVALHTLLLIGMIFLSFKAKSQLMEIIITSLIYFTGSFLGVMINSQLDEMAGMLFIFFPIFALAYFVIASFNFIFQKFKGN